MTTPPEPLDRDRIRSRAAQIVSGPAPRDEKLLCICRLLADLAPSFNWVGFYIADDRERELRLGPYVGEPTEHARIPFGRGICGQAAERKETFVVDDVSKETNYLACSVKVRSEIVVPVMKDGRVMAELDIDSHTACAFAPADREMLEQICRMAAALF